jgi:hypothetical protein
MGEDTAHFYKHLTPLSGFQKSLDSANLTPLPKDWVFFITDIVSSTELFHNNGYRKINQTAAACLTAVLNATEYKSIPYVFGGDGVQLATPAKYHDKTHKALHAVAHRVEGLYGIELRVAGFPINTLNENGHEILVGKLALSDEVDQAVFSGNGVAAIDHWIRQGDWSLEQPTDIPEPDLTGLECRWKEIPGKNEEIINLMIQVLPGHPNPAEVYRKVSEWLEDAFGPEADRHPLRPKDLEMHTDAAGQSFEVDFKNCNSPQWSRAIKKHWTAFETKLGKKMMSEKMNLMGVDWGKYFQDIILFGDHQKFNGMLALTSSTSAAKRKTLVEKLEAAHQQGELAYGIHLTNKVIITCMIMDRATHHRHFIDGAGGGYTLASKDFKARLLRLAR